MGFAVDVIVPMFGQQYEQWALDRAIPSAHAQTLAPAAVIGCVGRNPADARNNGAAAGVSEWLCFLDADDELAPRYLEAMSAGTADVRGPATEFHKVTGVEGPLLVPVRDLERMNYLVIGSLVRRDLFERVGGFKDWPVHEDYCLWYRCARAGATFEQLEGAVYRVHERPTSRNRKSLTYKRAIDARIRRAAQLAEEGNR